MRAAGFDHRTSAARRKLRQFIEEHARDPDIPEREIRRSRSYLLRCLGLHLSAAIVLPTKNARSIGLTRGGGLAHRNRLRTAGQQGRPHKAAVVKDLLFRWFCLIRRSVRSRIPPLLMITKARLLMEEQGACRPGVASRRSSGLIQSVASVETHLWCQSAAAQS